MYNFLEQAVVKVENSLLMTKFARFLKEDYSTFQM